MQIGSRTQNQPCFFAGPARVHRQLRGAVHRADGHPVDGVVRDAAAADARQHVQQRPLSRLRRRLHLPRHQGRRGCLLGEKPI